MKTDQATSAKPEAVCSTAMLGPLPEAALTVVHNPHTMERQVSTHGVAYYGSNWYAERECYTAEQMRAYAAEQVAAERERCARTPLTRQQIDDVMTQHYPLSSLLREEVDAFEACVRDIERLHGIGA